MKSLRNSFVLAVAALAPLLPNIAQARCICECQAELAINGLLKGIHDLRYSDFSNADLESKTESTDADGETVTKSYKYIAEFYQGDRPADMAQQAPQEWEVVARSKKDADAADCEILSLSKVRDLPPTSGKPEQK